PPSIPIAPAAMVREYSRAFDIAGAQLWVGGVDTESTASGVAEVLTSRIETEGRGEVLDVEIRTTSRRANIAYVTLSDDVDLERFLENTFHVNPRLDGRPLTCKLNKGWIGFQKIEFQRRDWTVSWGAREPPPYLSGRPETGRRSPPPPTSRQTTLERSHTRTPPRRQEQSTSRFRPPSPLTTIPSEREKSPPIHQTRARSRTPEGRLATRLQHAMEVDVLPGQWEDTLPRERSRSKTPERRSRRLSAELPRAVERENNGEVDLDGGMTDETRQDLMKRQADTVPNPVDPHSQSTSNSSHPPPEPKSSSTTFIPPSTPLPTTNPVHQFFKIDNLPFLPGGPRVFKPKLTGFLEAILGPGTCHDIQLIEGTTQQSAVVIVDSKVVPEKVLYLFPLSLPFGPSFEPIVSPFIPPPPAPLSIPLVREPSVPTGPAALRTATTDYPDRSLAQLWVSGINVTSASETLAGIIASRIGPQGNRGVKDVEVVPTKSNLDMAFVTLSKEVDIEELLETLQRSGLKHKNGGLPLTFKLNRGWSGYGEFNARTRGVHPGGRGRPATARSLDFPSHLFREPGRSRSRSPAPRGSRGSTPPSRPRSPGLARPSAREDPQPTILPRKRTHSRSRTPGGRPTTNSEPAMELDVQPSGRERSSPPHDQPRKRTRTGSRTPERRSRRSSVESTQPSEEQKHGVSPTSETAPPVAEKSRLPLSTAHLPLPATNDSKSVWFPHIPSTHSSSLAISSTGPTFPRISVRLLLSHHFSSDLHIFSDARLTGNIRLPPSFRRYQSTRRSVLDFEGDIRE
ncbi:hypothetical protein P7C70_g7893, partial [Phenoliferia sp. Uapishka_3]